MIQSMTKIQKSASILFALLLLASLFFLVHPWYDRVRDASVYISTARALLSGEGYHHLGIPFIIRPPGLSVLISPLIAWLDTNFLSLNLLVSLFGAAGIFLLYLFLHPRLGGWLAMLTATAIWLNPCYRLLCNQVMSDIPGLALTLSCLWLERWTSHRCSWRRELLLGVAIGIAAYVRSIVILLVPAIIIARLFARFLANKDSLS